MIAVIIYADRSEAWKRFGPDSVADSDCEPGEECKDKDPVIRAECDAWLKERFKALPDRALGGVVLCEHIARTMKTSDGRLRFPR